MVRGRGTEVSAEGSDEGNIEKDAAPLDRKEWTVAGGENSGEGLKLKMTGYRIENNDYGQDWSENKRRAERRPRRLGMSSSDPGVVEPCTMDQEIGKLATR